MTILRLLLSSVLVCESLSSTTSTRINLGPGVYAGHASYHTTPCWPDMTAVALSYTPQISTVAYTDQNVRSSTIAKGQAVPYGRTTFRTKVDPGSCFYIHEHHDFPRSAVELHDQALRIPFCIKDAALTMYLEASSSTNGKIHGLRCPLNLTWVDVSRPGTLSDALGLPHEETRTEASQEVRSQSARSAGLPLRSLPVGTPFRKQVVTAVGRVIVEGMLPALGPVPPPPASYQRTSAAVVREAVDLDDSAMRSAWWGLTPGLYVGEATDVTRQCWPDMANVSLVISPKSAEPQMSSMICTGRDGSILPIVAGYPRRYSIFSFQRRVHAGESFYYINARHNSPRVAPRLSRLRLSPRIPFCLRGAGLVMYLEARLGAGNSKFSDLDCPLYLNKISNLTTATPDSQAWVPSTSAVMAKGEGEEVTTGGHDSTAPGGREEPEREDELTRSKSLPRAKQAQGESGALHNGRQVLSGHRPGAAVVPAAPRGHPKAQTSSQGMVAENNGGKAKKSGTDPAVRNEIEKMGEKRKRSPERSSQADTQRAKQVRAEDGRAVERLHRGGRPATGSRRLPRPFHKQGITDVGKVIVEGMLTLREGEIEAAGSVGITFESLIDNSFISFPFPGVLFIYTDWFSHDCFGEGPRTWSIVRHLHGLSELTPELAAAEGIMQISPLRVDNIYICINSGMWRIHLGEETVDGLGREVVLPLVDVDDPFDPLD